MSTLSLAALDVALGDLGLKTPVPQYHGTDVLNDPLDIARSYLAEEVQKIVQCGPEHAYGAIQLPTSIDPFSGDIVIILPKLAREAGIDIEELRQNILKQFPSDHPLFQVPISDQKQLKVYYHSKKLAQLVLTFILDRNGYYGASSPEPATSKSKLLLEFSSPNIVAEMNGKHFRSTLLGAQLANLYRGQGWDVTKINYLGDWGKPIGLLGAGYERFGSDELLETDPIGHLRDVYKRISELFAPEQAASKKARDDEKAREETGDSAEIESKGIFAERNAFFARLENNDERAVALWNKIRTASIENYVKEYGRLNVEFDEYSGESTVKPETMHEVENALKEKGICEESEGSLVIHLQNHGSKHGTAIIRDRTGSSTYLLREIAAAVERHKEHGFDRMVYVVANDQHSTHFHRLTKILELIDMGELASKLHHASFNEAARLPEPSETDEPLVHILDRCEELMQKSLTAHSRQASLLLTDANAPSNLTASACYAQASSAKRSTDIKFEMDGMSSFQPGNALYLLDWFARLSTIPTVVPDPTEPEAEGEGYLDDDNALLLRWLAHYPEIVQASFRNTEPSLVMTYLGNIVSQLSDCYEDDEAICASSAAHAQFLEAIRIVLSNGLRLLGITRTGVRDSGVFV